MAKRTPEPESEPDPDNPLRDIPADRPGLPARDSIVGVEKFVSPQNDEYTILRTTETDAYDPPPRPKTEKDAGATSPRPATTRRRRRKT